MVGQYKCTGANDADMIQAAIKIVGPVGGTIILSDGEFVISKPINLTQKMSIMLHLTAISSSRPESESNNPETPKQRSSA